MPRAKLTKAVVDSLSYGGSNGAKFIVWDQSTPGFGLRVFPTGRRAYVVSYRHAGRQRLLTLGAATLDDARRKARLVLAEARDSDPVERRRVERAKGITLGEAVSAYLSTRALKPSTVGDYRKAMRLTFADWEGLPLSRITRDLVEKRFDKASERGTASANRDFRFLRALLTFASERFAPSDGEALLASNPCDRLKALKRWHPARARDRVVKPDQFRSLLEAIDLTETDSESQREGKVFVSLLLATGARFGEAAALRWNDVDLDSRTLRFAETKNGRAHTLPLGDWLHGRLVKLSRRDDRIFPGAANNGRRTIQALSKALSVPFSAHDLRRSFGTIASQRCTHAVLKRLMNHASAGDVTLTHYVRLDVTDLRAPMAAIEAFILGSAGRLPSTLVDLPDRRKRALGG